MIAWAVMKVPQLIGFIGITSFKTVKNIVHGIQQARVELSNYNDDHKFSKNDVRKILDTNLGTAMDADDVKCVEHAKKKCNMPSTKKH